CSSTFTGLLKELQSLGSRLDIGLSYDEYTNAVGDVKVVYDQTDFAGLDDLDCLSAAGLPLERALNQYVKASNVWGACFDDYACSNDSIRPELQKHWSKASASVELADGGLADMEP
ncbi:MAG: hypothetical protein H0U07_12415, partial [Actinobacteria bacterium]|nr:hypothetical protein [Actinomycetota bacterium]